MSRQVSKSGLSFSVATAKIVAMVLYRKYRPQALAEVVGQDHIRDPLLAALRTGKITHAYLFSGSRGTGKTSVARIIAKAVNCQKTESREQRAAARFDEPCNACESCVAINAGTHLDLIEIDAASNRGIDEIRDLREKIKLSPAAGLFKVYIIDEAHMLTPEAFNALLKTLEEPPEHAIFILATTEPQKIPATIASRTTRFDFKVPTVTQIQEKLLTITKNEGWRLPEEVLEEISKAAGGAFRDAEVLLEKVASVDPGATLEKTREILGTSSATSALHLLKLIQEGQTRDSLIWLDDYLWVGGSLRVLAESVLEVIRKALLLQAGAGSVIGAVTEEEMKGLESLAKTTTKERLLELTEAFNQSIDELRNATIPQLPLEIAIIEATLKAGASSVEEAPSRAKEFQVAESQLEKGEEKIATTETQRETETRKTAASKAQKQTETRKESVRDKQTVDEKAAVAQNKVLKKLQAGWSKFLKEVKPENASLETFLRGAKPIDIDEDLLTIEFVYRFHKEKVEERKYREVVEEVLKKFTGSPLRIKGVVGERPAPPAGGKKEEPAGSPAKEDIDPAEVFGKLD